MASSLDERDQEVNFHNLLKWVCENDGYLHPNVCVMRDHERGFHVRVKKDKMIAAMTRIVSCPMSCTLSILNAMDVAPFQCHGTRFPRAFIRRQPHMVVQSFFLMEQYLLKSKSWWASYIACLPSPDDIELFDFTSESDLAWLEGTNLRHAFVKQTEQWQESFSSGLAQLKQLQWPQAIQNKYTWNLYRWAAKIFGSRSFSSQVLADTLPADRARPIGEEDIHHDNLNKLFSEGFPVLLPLLDLLNHQPKSKVEWQARYSFVGLQVLEQFLSDQEICNNYGPRDNEVLLLSYGFVIENNPFDHYSIALKIPSNSPLDDIRTWPPDPRSDPERRCYIFNSNHPNSVSSNFLEFSLFSYDLLDAISVLSGNDRELQNMFRSRKTWIGSGLSRRFEDNRNILATLSQIMRECLTRMKVIVKSTSKKGASKRKHCLALVYRTSQLSILMTAVSLCKYVLLRARGKNVTEWETSTCPESESPPMFFTFMNYNHEYNSIRLKLFNIIQLHPCISKPGELLQVDDLLDMMQQELSSSIRNFLDEFEEVMRAVQQISKLEVAKSRLAVVLGVLRFQYTRGERLISRLQMWFDRLCEWYPQDDPNWCFVPDESTEGAPPTLLTCLATAKAILSRSHHVVNGSLTTKRFLEPEILCWGWNVMEEEGVIIPAEIEGPVTGDGNSNLDLVIYCPRI